MKAITQTKQQEIKYGRPCIKCGLITIRQSGLCDTHQKEVNQSE